MDVSPKESIEILGNSRWIFDSMDPQSYYDLGTKIFASEQIANTPVEFSINIDYISNEELKKESLVVGAYIEGQIKITGHDFEIRKVGDTPNFGGNLLNEGNSRALFTKVNLEELKPVSDLVSNNTNIIIMISMLVMIIKKIITIIIFFCLDHKNNILEILILILHYPLAYLLI